MTEVAPEPDDVVLDGRKQLYTLLHELKRNGFELGPADYARLDRVLVLLTALGIAPEDPRAAPWLGPILCGSPGEQVLFHLLFKKHVTRELEEPLDLNEPQRLEERAVERDAARLRQWLGLGLLGTLVGIVIAAIVLVTYDGWPFGTSGPTVGVMPELFASTTGGRLLRAFFGESLAFLPLLAAFGFILWRRSRRLWLLRDFAPPLERVERVAFAAALPHLFGNPFFRHALGALRRHRVSPDGPLHVPRTISATVRAGGRPVLRFGTRPHTPEYVLLVDRESPRDHLPVVADLLMSRFTEEHIIVIRYDYYGDPRRVVRPSNASVLPQHFRLADLMALHRGHAILILAEAGSFFDDRGQPRRWLAHLREWSQPILLTPRPPKDWGWAERGLECEGALVIPATPEGLAGYAERLKLGPGVPLPLWQCVLDPTLDLPSRLERYRVTLLDDASPDDAVIAELLLELEAWLGLEGFVLLKALAVFPRLEPALTLYLGREIPGPKGQPLLDETRFLALARLPWLRTGRMPDWLRLALVRQLELKQLTAITDLLQAFLQPVEDPHTGAMTLEVGRRRSHGFRKILLEWIGNDRVGEFDDRIFIDALQGRQPQDLGIPVPTSLARQLRRVAASSEWSAAGLGLALSVILTIFHTPIVATLDVVLNWIGASIAFSLDAGTSSALVLGWGCLIGALVRWHVPQSSLLQGAASGRIVQASILLGAAALLSAIGQAARISTPASILATASAGTLLLFLAVGASDLRTTVLTYKVIAQNRRWHTFFYVFLSSSCCLLIPTSIGHMIAFHDRFYEIDLLVGVEAATAAITSTAIFFPLLLSQKIAAVPQSDAWRLGVCVGIGQSLVSLIFLGIAFLLPENGTLYLNNSPSYWMSFYVFLRTESVLFFIIAIYIKETRELNKKLIGAMCWSLVPHIVLVIEITFVILFYDRSDNSLYTGGVWYFFDWLFLTIFLISIYIGTAMALKNFLEVEVFLRPEIGLLLITYSLFLFMAIYFAVNSEARGVSVYPAALICVFTLFFAGISAYQPTKRSAFKPKVEVNEVPTQTNIDETAAPSKPSRILIALLVAMTALAPISLQIFLPALPAIQTTFQTTSAKTQLVLSLSILANAVATLLYGPLSDRFGRRPVVLAGIAIFILGSLLSAVAGSLKVLILGRIIQSAGAAAGMVLARAIVRDLYDREAAAQVIAYLTMAMVIGPMLAPILGALLIDHIGWRAIFLVTIVVGLLIGWLAVMRLIETRPGQAGPAAWSGLLRGGSQLLQSPAFLAYTLQNSFATAMFFAFISGAPYFMIGTLGRSATEYGLWFMLISGAFIVGNFTAAARLTRGIGLDRMILIGASLCLVGAVLMQACMLAGWWTVPGMFGPMLLAAFGNGLAIANAQAGAISVMPRLAGTASGMTGFLQLLAAATVSQLIGMAPHDTPMPMAAVVLLCAIGSLAAFVLPRWRLAAAAVSGRR